MEGLHETIMLIKVNGVRHDEIGQLCNKIAEVYEKFGEVKANEFYRKLVDLIDVEERYMKNDVKKNSVNDLFDYNYGTE